MIARIKQGVIPGLAAAALLLAGPVSVTAQRDYPSRTIKIVVPAPPGSNLDTVPRNHCRQARGALGSPGDHREQARRRAKPRGGGGREIGAGRLHAACHAAGPLVISQHFFPKLGFDPTAFVPVSIVASQPLVLVAHPKLPVSNLKELVASAKASPKRISFASAGIGSSPHLTGEMLKSAAGIDFVHVPYKGLAPAMTDLIAGHVDIMFNNLSNALPQIKDGNLKALGVASDRRIPELPDLPAVAEMFPGFYSTSWFAVVAPPKTPASIAAKLSEAIAEILRQPDVIERFRALSSTPVGTSPVETAAFLRKESERWRQVIVAASIKPE